MKRNYTTFSLTSISNFKSQLLNFGNNFSNFFLLDSNGYASRPEIECLAGAGVYRELSIPEQDIFQRLDTFIDQRADYLFCQVNYDLKNEISDLTSRHTRNFGFPDYYFFEPETIFIFSGSDVRIGTLGKVSPGEIFERINAFAVDSPATQAVRLIPTFSKEEYVYSVKKILDHIHRGDCYEACFCQEFIAHNCSIDPVAIFRRLQMLSPNPFSAFYKYEHNFLLCASPERFLKKVGSRVISQPIKGTAARLDPFREAEEKAALLNNAKERSENIMIVDLVRNDLSKICREGTVEIEEYLSIYSFPQVHQMISTIAGELDNTKTFSDVLRATFPMGSMTGAPKKRAMEILDYYERSRRGLYSGTIGYISPTGDYDLNVVIRSILYNDDSGFVSINAGGAITAMSDPEKEYEECKIKISAMAEALQ